MAQGPEVYGGAVWDFIHITCGQADTPLKRSAYQRWIREMPLVFPCERCGKHLAESLIRYPVENYLTSAERLLYHSYLLHEEANQHYNRDHPEEPMKRSPPWSEVRKKYLVEDYTPLPSHPSLPAPVYPNRLNTGRTMLLYPSNFEQFRYSFKRR